MVNLRACSFKRNDQVMIRTVKAFIEMIIQSALDNFFAKPTFK